ncbi:MAG: hypothetical protein JW940_08020 [Polyangiaceae bacterium]|nr:hypothetical protein [Polyangiaceae bacterium]
MSVPSEVYGSPKVWAGSSYATVWVSNHQTSYTNRRWFDLEYGRFGPDGSLLAQHTVFSTYELDANATPVDYGTATARSITKIEQGFAVTWHEIDQSRLRFALLDRDGNLMSEPTAVATAEGLNAPLPRVVWTGSGFGVLWGGFDTVSFAVLDEQGSLLNSGSVMDSLAIIGRLFLFWEHDHYAVLIENYHQALNEVYFAKVDREARPLGEPRRLSDPDTTYTSPLWAGQTPNGYRVVLSVRGRTHAVATLLGIVELDREGIETAPPQPITYVELIDLVWSGVAFGATWREQNALNFGLLGLDGSLRSNAIELAVPVPTNDGTRVPAVADFDWHDGVFGVFFSQPTAAAEGQRLYTQIACEP